MKNLSILAGLVYLALVATLFIGWVKCIIKLTECDFEPSYKAEAIYAVGTVTGFGCIIGYMDLGK